MTTTSDIETLFEIEGYVIDAEVLSPRNHVYMERPKYMLTLQAQEAWHVKELVARAEWVKLDKSSPYDKLNNPHYGTHQDDISDGDRLVYFESLRQPSLMDDLKQVINDHQLIGKYVKIVGYIKYMRDGNVYLSFHIIEPKFDPNIVEGVEEGDDYDEDDFDI